MLKCSEYPPVGSVRRVSSGTQLCLLGNFVHWFLISPAFLLRLYFISVPSSITKVQNENLVAVTCFILFFFFFKLVPHVVYSLPVYQALFGNSFSWTERVQLGSSKLSMHYSEPQPCHVYPGCRFPAPPSPSLFGCCCSSCSQRCTYPWGVTRAHLCTAAAGEPSALLAQPRSWQQLCQLLAFCLVSF